MSEVLQLPTTSDRKVMYTALLPQVDALLQGETDAIAAMANVAAALHQAFRWHWVGFYRVLDDELVLGPFQGPIACSRIGYGKGVCGLAWSKGEVIIVPDVDEFPGHIACSALSRSEIVLPLRNRGGSVVAVLDIDSALLNDLTAVDAEGLRSICAPLERLLA